MRVTLLASVAATLVLVGCAPATIVKTNQLDLARMQPDCKNHNRQIRYLESQLDRPSGVIFKEASETQERSYRATAMSKIWEIREKCSK